MLLGRAGVAAADTGASSPAICRRPAPRSPGHDAWIGPSGSVRIVRTLTPQILDWKERISEKGELGRTAGCRAKLETEAIGTGRVR
jgi:hypothetical protein